jgi:hypothetical protein
MQDAALGVGYVFEHRPGQINPRGDDHGAFRAAVEVERLALCGREFRDRLAAA